MSGKYAFFLGCIAPLRYPGIELATREIFKALNVDLLELEGAGCCPAPGVIRSFDQTTWLALGARNLALAEAMSADIMTICNGCYGSLFEANHTLQHYPEELKKVNEVLGKAGMRYNGTVKVRHFAEFLYKDVGMEKIKAQVKNPLSYNVAVHYGCHFAKPTKVKQLDDAERPRILDELVEATGAKSIYYKDKLMCCGAGGGVRSRDNKTALKMTEEKLKNLKKTEAQMILDVCPFCHLQYDASQADLPGYNIPVIHLSQLYGMAFGLPRDKLGLEAHVTPVNL
jgi:heterodisulfide reductase subunit B